MSPDVQPTENLFKVAVQNLTVPAAPVAYVGLILGLPSKPAEQFGQGHPTVRRAAEPSPRAGASAARITLAPSGRRPHGLHSRHHSPHATLGGGSHAETA